MLTPRPAIIAFVPALLSALLLGLGSGCSAPTEPSSSAVGQTARGTQCGPTLDLELVHDYAGPFPFVDAVEDAVILVDGTCTGTHVELGVEGYDFVLTAGHCVELGQTVTLVANYELNADGEVTEWQGQVVERSDAPDYALIASTPITTSRPVRLGRRYSTDLLMIQHPVGLPKVVASGQFAGCSDGLLTYTDLDTLTGASGAGVFNERGELVAVHALGACDIAGGVNAGWVIPALAEVSPIITYADIH